MNWTSYLLNFTHFKWTGYGNKFQMCFTSSLKPSKCPSKHSAWIDPVVVQQFWEKRCETISGGSFLALLSGGGIGCQIIPSKIRESTNTEPPLIIAMIMREGGFKLFRQSSLDQRANNFESKENFGKHFPFSQHLHWFVLFIWLRKNKSVTSEH